MEDRGRRTSGDKGQQAPGSGVPIPQASPTMGELLGVLGFGGLPRRAGAVFVFVPRVAPLRGQRSSVTGSRNTQTQTGAPASRVPARADPTSWGRRSPQSWLETWAKPGGKFT